MVNVAPSVDAYDETTYRAQAGDTFAGVSKKYLGSDAYAAALVQYNREHPQNQSPAADGLRKDPPTLAPGQPVFIPPLYILEKRYPGVVNLPPLSAVTPAAPAAAMAPQTSNSFGSPPAPAPAPAGWKQYRVRQSNGEFYRDIARYTLGNSERWTDIYNLNRTISPNYPVPAGTVLNLPNTATVPPENVP